MTAPRLTDEKLLLFASTKGGIHPVDDAGYPCECWDCCEVRTMAAELRHLRALLTTEMPCGWDEPRVAHGDVYVSQGIEGWVSPDEAIALGMALVRAGLAAKGEKP